MLFGKYDKSICVFYSSNQAAMLGKIKAVCNIMAIEDNWGVFGNHISSTLSEIGKIA